MLEATRKNLSIYIDGTDICMEIFYIAFPRFSGPYCCYNSLESWQRDRLDQMLVAAKETCEQLNNSQEEITKKLIKKTFESLS